MNATLEVTRNGELDQEYYDQIARQERTERLSTAFGNIATTFTHVAYKTAEKAGKGALLAYSSVFDDMHGTSYVSELKERWEV